MKPTSEYCSLFFDRFNCVRIASCSKTHLQVYNSPLLIKRSNFHEPSDHSQDEKWEGAKVKARRLQSRNTWDKISRTDCTQRQMMACSSYLIVFAVRLFHSIFSFYIPVIHHTKRYVHKCSASEWTRANQKCSICILHNVKSWKYQARSPGHLIVP